MSEKQMRIIEQLAEIIMDQVEFKDKRELHKFTNDLKNLFIVKVKVKVQMKQMMMGKQKL
jgi:hypothetical protein